MRPGFPEKPESIGFSELSGRSSFTRRLTFISMDHVLGSLLILAQGLEQEPIKKHLHTEQLRTLLKTLFLNIGIPTVFPRFAECGPPYHAIGIFSDEQALAPDQFAG